MKKETPSFSYNLPRENIALYPASPRHLSRLMVVDLSSFKISHRKFKDITDYLESPDKIVINNSRVICARLKGRKSTGGKAEFLLLEKKDNLWKAYGKPVSRLREGMKIKIKSPRGDCEAVKIINKLDGGIFFLQAPEDILKYGYIPLPPYIVSRRDLRTGDYADYQTNFAQVDGSVASSTASLHFSKELTGKLKEKGVSFVPVTLHIGPGTFKPDYDIPDPEKYEFSPDSAGKLNGPGRICACGTTVIRTLETVYSGGKYKSSRGETNIFITPGRKFSPISLFLTNFHLPGTPLLLMVAAFIEQYYPGRGRELTLNLYREALDKNYRFLSYGDAMLLIGDPDGLGAKKDV
ncbi:MAG: S-adenosylmethionine:tRNA ribosyltransferase-isomerase [Elusimicrobiota bacterium]|nr:S-adenosylmethionine:tRNA ribosyltransferase-isomerase [Elusimicrobiota bacterium]